MNTAIITWPATLFVTRRDKNAIAVKAPTACGHSVNSGRKSQKENLVLLGIPVIGMKKSQNRRSDWQQDHMRMHNPVLYDVLLGEEVHGQKIVSPYDFLPSMKRWQRRSLEFWKEQLDKCIRCMPVVSLSDVLLWSCFIDQLKPNGQIRPASPGNIMYHLTRFISGRTLYRLRRVFTRLSGNILCIFS